MEDRSWVRLALVGIVLLAIVIGYFIYTRASNQSQQTTQTPSIENQSPVPTFTPESSASPSPAGSPGVTASPSPSGEMNQTQTKGGQTTNVSTLPNTGFPMELAGIFSASAITTGWFLRKFPK